MAARTGSALLCRLHRVPIGRRFVLHKPMGRSRGAGGRDEALRRSDDTWIRAAISVYTSLCVINKTVSAVWQRP